MAIHAVDLGIVVAYLAGMVLVGYVVAVLSPRRRWPLAGALSSWGGLLAVAVFFLIMHVWGAPYADLDTRRLTVAGVDILREYALFFALPVSALGFVAGSIVGRRR